MIHDATICKLGEGPLWHPERNELFWFDILGRKLHRKDESWDFAEHPSAAGWIDSDTLLIATQTAFKRFDIETGATEILADFEADNPATRSNDGRADPQGGLWVGTMGLNAEADAGAIYRFYKGELRRLLSPITIPNAICFAPDGGTAYFCDTIKKIIHKVRLDAQGWPKGEPETHIDLRGTDLNPDGAVVDAAGNLWNAQWGASRVACYGPDGSYLHAIAFPGTQTSCPAFGGADLKTLFCTSAAIGLSDDNPDQGKTFATLTEFRGQPEHRIVL